MIVEELISKLGLEVDSSAIGVLEKFKNMVSSGLGSITAAAVGLGAAFVGVVASTAHAADEIDDAAEKLGVNAQALQELRVAAELSDVSFEALAIGLKFVQKNAVEAAQGSKEAAAAFAGIDLRDANGQIKSADQLLMGVAKRFETITNPAQQTNLAMKIFGRSGADLLPFLRKGEAGIAAFRQEAEELGVVFGEDALKAGDDFGREMVRIKFAMEGLRNQFAVPFMKVFVLALKGVVKLAKQLQPAFRDIGLAFFDAGLRMARFADIFKKGYQAFTAWFNDTSLGKILKQQEAFKLSETTLDLLKAALIGFGAIAVTTALAAAGAWLLSIAPLLLLALLIGLLVDDIAAFAAGNDSAFGRYIAWLDSSDKSANMHIETLRVMLGLISDLANGERWKKALDTAGVWLFNAATQALVVTLQTLLATVGALVDTLTGGSTDVLGFLNRTAIQPLQNARQNVSQYTQQQITGRSSDSLPLVNASEQTKFLGPTKGGMQQTNYFTIQGVTGEDVANQISGVLSREYSSAQPAVNGGRGE